jgi:hypothetical protein
MALPTQSEWYLCDGRWLTPAAVGYEAAAFYRYRGMYGADQSNKIEYYPSWQWDYYGNWHCEYLKHRVKVTRA